MNQPSREQLLKSLPDYVTKEGELISQDQVAKYEKLYNSSAYPTYDDEQVDQILNTDTKEQQCCEMCHAALTQRPYDSQEFQQQLTHFASFKNGFDRSKIQKIKYCLWCGRKLDKWQVFDENDQPISYAFRSKEAAKTLCQQLTGKQKHYSIKNINSL